MPLSVATRLGLYTFKPTQVTLVLADRSTRRPEGVLENLPVQIGNCYIPTDFIVLKLDEESQEPILLGRPFLATAGAMINVKEGKIDLHMDDLILRFNLEKAAKKPTIDDHLSRLRIDEEIPIDDRLPEENVYVVAAFLDCYKEKADVKVLQQTVNDSPWYADIANYLCVAEEPPNFNGYAKKKFLRDVQRYFWDEPFLYKHCADGLYRRCVPESE
ncbi:PREDICTED: uncharacterized protein LOC104774183, partial [Camelina sativa]|uniref:Uncharacterized protein LOC104774183 n=1 Tax=Camelina sativa TaxID=90675 RepID=A0ABM0Y8E6_CAMSA